MPPKADPYATKVHRRIDVVLFAVVFAIVAILLSSSARATSLYWDSNTTAVAGAGTAATATGIWGTNSFWNTSSTGLGGTTQVNTTAADDLFFSAGSDATGTFTVTVLNGTTVSGRGITLEEGNVTLAFGNATSRLSLGAGGITINSGATLNLTVATTIAAAQSWTNNGAGTLSADSMAIDNLLTLNGGAFSFTVSSGGGDTTGAGGVKITNNSTVTNSGTGAIFGTGTLELNSGTYRSNNTSTRTLANALSITGDFTFDAVTSGQNVFTGGGTTTGNRILTVNTVNTTLSTKALSLGGNLTTAGTGALTLSGGLNLNGADRTITGGATGATTISGPIESGASAYKLTLGGDKVTLGAVTATTTNPVNVEVNATGTVTFNGANSYAGSTTLTAGTLLMSGSGTFGSTSNALAVNGGTLNLNGTSQGVGALNGSGGAITNNSGTTSTLTVGNGGGSGSYSGKIDNGTGTVSLTKTGSGTETITNVGNTYSGVTTVSGGVLSVTKLADGALASSIGQRGNEGATGLVLDGGTLRYTGTGDSTARLFTVNTTGGTIEASGTGALNFTSSGSTAIIATPGTGPRTLTLSGTNTGANTMAPLLSQGTTNSNDTSLTKAGSGTWILTGNNTYKGTTQVTGGTLLVNGNQSTATGAVTVTGSGTVLGGSGTIGGTGGGTVNVASGNSISPGATAGNTSVGTLTTGALTLASNSNYVLTLSGTTSDLLNVIGGSSIGLSNLLVNVASPVALNSTFTILQNNTNSLLTGQFASGTTVRSVDNRYAFTIAYGVNGGDGSANDITMTTTEVPEPSTWAAAGLSLAFIGFTQRRRVQKLVRVRRS